MQPQRIAVAHSVAIEPEELLTVAQAAAEATRRCGPGFAESTLWRHIDKGALPIVRCGPERLPRIRRDDFERYLNPEF